MIEIDSGSGGGQLVRTALSLSVLTGEPIAVENVRGGRSTPGLRPQHLAAVEVLASICGAETSGVEAGATSFVFEPDRIEPGRYEVDIGTAGSVTLVFDAVLPLAFALDGPLSLHATGGTAVKWSPPLTTHRRVKLPLLREHGIFAAIERRRTGFYPAGGGEAILRLVSAAPTRIDLVDRGQLSGIDLYARASESLSDAAVGERLCESAREEVTERDLPLGERAVTYADTRSSGATLVARLRFADSLAGIDVLGERGVPSESVASSAVDGVASFLETGAAVDEHLADQLLPFLTLAGGRLSIPSVTDHVQSSLDLFEMFGLGVTPTDHAGHVELVAPGDPDRVDPGHRLD